MKGLITAKDVARYVGVSQSAVSRTFTEGASVAPETRAKIIEAARKLGYRPNALARSLITHRSYMIGVLVGHPENKFYQYVLDILVGRLRARGYKILLFSGVDAPQEETVVEDILQYQLDGLVLISSNLSELLARECEAAGVPIVMYNRKTSLPSGSSVTNDNRNSSRELAQFLIAGGHQRFAYVAGISSSSTNQDREAGFYEGLEAAGIRDCIRVSGQYTHSGASEAARYLFSHPMPPDAVFCANDYMAAAVMDVARYEFGLEIPRDLSVVGYDDAWHAAWSSYALTTVDQSASVMVDHVIETLLGHLDGTIAKPVHIVVPNRIIVRKSARLPPTGLVETDGHLTWMLPETPPQAPPGPLPED
ncbi:LacI family DNA-binding transcriptional regulator [Pseudochelatococcus sp. B33]